MGKARRILEEARSRDEWYKAAWEGLMHDQSALEGMRQDITRERITCSPEIESRMDDLLESIEIQLVSINDGMKESLEKFELARRLIDVLDNQRWKEVLSCYYLGQMGWRETAERMHTTEEGAKKARDRALENLDAR